MDAHQLPKPFADHADAAAFAREFAARAEPLWSGGSPRVPRLELTPELEDALRSAQSGRRLIRGLERATEALQAQQHGLAAVDSRTGVARQQRVSRALILADDGAERFYRQVDQLLTRHTPRVAALRLRLDQHALGEAFFGGQQVARLLLVDHKEAVSRVLASVATTWRAQR